MRLFLERLHRGRSRFSDNLALSHVALNLGALDLARNRSKNAGKDRSEKAENEHGHGSYLSWAVR